MNRQSMYTAPERPLVALAPMAGVTDFAYRELCARLTPTLFTTTEMVSSRGLCYGDRKSATLMRISDAESWASIQLFGCEPDFMARAAEQAAQMPGVRALDVNMGCPIPKIVSSGDGCALMRDLPRAVAIVRAMAGAVSLPITVKFRKGWDRGHVNAVEFAAAMEQAGAAALCVHGRTKMQMYSGVCDWDIIAAVKRAVRIPVTASGDIDSPGAALRCRNLTGADAFMIGRAAFGDPWLPGQIDAALRNQPIPDKPPWPQRLDTALAQCRRAADIKGERIACLEARKHLSWYLHGRRDATSQRSLVMSVETLQDVERVIEQLKRDG